MKALRISGTGYESVYAKRFYRCFEDSDFCKKLHIANSFINSLSSEAAFQPSVPWLRFYLSMV